MIGEKRCKERREGREKKGSGGEMKKTQTTPLPPPLFKHTHAHSFIHSFIHTMIKKGDCYLLLFIGRFKSRMNAWDS